MKKPGILILIALLVALLACVWTANAQILPPLGPGQQIGWPAVVLCDRLALHEKPLENSRVIAYLDYRDEPIVINADLPEGPMEENGFVYCTTGDSEDSPNGWISTESIIINPAMYVTESETFVYAWNDLDAPKVALLKKNTAVPAFLDPDTCLPILKDESDWLLVSLRGAVGWIHK
ncbi:MAG: hypothetical protein IKI24_06545 [Clostridia bacterium]|nr:hypothetical protein [Clostridia bacterium]MCR4578646.1 hypothetical protein [Clostridiales bacterium]